MEVYAIFCTRVDFTKTVSNVIRFRENHKYRKHVHEDDIYGSLSPSTAIL